MKTKTSGIPLAYFITFTCYGSRLHGDSRETVDHYHNAFLEPKCPPNKNRQAYHKKNMTGKSYLMNETDRQRCLHGLQDTSAFFDWRLYAAHVRSNHVHVVIAADKKPEFVMTQLKARASRRLNTATHNKQITKRWSRHGSTRYLWTDTSLLFAMQYVILEQGEKMAYFVDPAFVGYFRG